MKSLYITKKNNIQTVEQNKPDAGENQVRLKITYVGICGSDLHYYNEGKNGDFDIKEPLIPGHELSGIIDIDPSNEFAKGTKVTVHPATFGDSKPEISDKPHLWPNGAYLGSASTWPHTQGAMSEYLVVNKSMVRVLPEKLSLKRAALAEPLSVALHAINMAGTVTEKRVLICGSGPIGALTAIALKIYGAKKITITDIVDGPLLRAQENGADDIINVMEASPKNEGYDIIFECTGAQSSISNAFKYVCRGGTIVQVGMNSSSSIPLGLLVSKEISIKGSFRFNNEINIALDMLADHDEFEKVITHNINADNVKDAFSIAKNSELSNKVVVEMW